MSQRTPITDELVRRLSVTSDTDTRSITRALAGLPVRGRAGERIRRALEAEGLDTANDGAPTSSPPPRAA